MKFLVFLGMIVASLIMVKYSKWIVDHTMRFPSIERSLGPTGTYSFWKLAGVATVAFAFWYLFQG
ncbi:MAG: hypothetical protein WCT32_03545 [Patescibacteria group bacterium]|jgi:hypothetical protein